MRRGRSSLALALLMVVAAGLLPARAGARDLHWRSLEVDARLDADGSLWVTERHAMVFDGDWNGGERIFRLGPGQTIELRSISRIGEDGERVRLAEGRLEWVDRYAWTDPTTVRWRSRLPTDPPFSSQEIAYVLDYRLEGVLQPRGGGTYVLDHDFAFPDRAGRIERFRLDLSIDPAFVPLEEPPRHLERRDLAPGESVVLTTGLRYRGEGRPPATLPPPAPFAARVAALLAMAAVLAWSLVRFERRERGLGRRWRRLPQPPVTDRAWLEERLLAFAPEEVGALWDRRIGPPEVAALLARLVAEGKLGSEVVEPGGEGEPAAGEDELRLRLLVERDAFTGYERALVDKLFYGGRDEVTTGQLRARYRAEGFDPAGIVRPGIEERLAARPETAPAGRPAPHPGPTAALFLVALALLIAELVTNRVSGGAVAGAAGVLLPWTYGLAAALAYASRGRVERLGLWAFLFGVPVVALAAGVGRAMFLPELAELRGSLGLSSVSLPAPGWFGTLALALVPVAVVRSVTNVAASRESPEAIALRQRLLQVRRHLAAELREARPALEDAWFPYLLALGLSGAVDRWSKTFGGTAAGAAGAAAAAAGSASSFTGASGGGSGAWTGGGGRFGGAGASASWAAAVTGVAAGVSTPSSSGGGGGGGGGSSGGGGGGGW